MAALLTIIPGLDTALVLRTALTRPRRYAVATALGICSGALVWGVAAAAGAAALLAASEIAFTVVKTAGALYMAYLGLSMLVRAWRGDRPRAAGTAPAVEPSVWRSFGVGAATNLLNPKVGVFYVALIPQFLAPGIPPVLMGFTLALVHVVETLVWFAFVIAASTLARRWFDRAGFRRGVDTVTGIALLGFATALLLDPRPAVHG